MLAAPPHARLGTLVATPEAMAAIPRDVLSRALRSHAHAESVEGEPFLTRHGWDGGVFCLRTGADRGETAIWLEGGRPAWPA